MKKMIKVFLLLISCSMLTSCSDDDDVKKGHVWKEQTDTINKAKDVEGILKDSAANMRKTIEDQESQ